MATGPNPVFNVETGQLVYPDGKVVNPLAPTASNSNTAQAQENIVGNIGCCSKVYSYAIPTELIVEAFREGLDPVTVSNDESIVITLRGERVAAPPEFGTTQILRAGATGVGWGLIPHSPFTAQHKTFMASPGFTQWLADNPIGPTAEEVPTGNVPAVQAWVDEDPDLREARAAVALEVELASDAPRSTLVSWLETIIG